MPRPGAGARPISPIEFDFLWEAGGAGEVPYPLEVRSHGATMGERAELRRRTLAELAGRGIIDATGRVEPRLAAYFGVLAGAQVSVDSVHVNEPAANALLAVVGTLDGVGLLAVQDERGLWLNEVDPEALASSVVSLLPAAPRGEERSITVPVEQLMAGAGADFLQRRDGSAAEEQRKALARLHAQPRLRGGQIGANVRTDGGRSRSPVLSWFDTESGRYLTRASTGTDGQEWITVAPVDAATMRRRIAEMIAGVQRGQEVAR